MTAILKNRLDQAPRYLPQAVDASIYCCYTEQIKKIIIVCRNVTKPQEDKNSCSFSALKAEQGVEPLSAADARALFQVLILKYVSIYVLL